MTAAITPAADAAALPFACSAPGFGRLQKLECGRGFAALYVFLYHCHLMPGTRWRFLFAFGPEAVMLFFLLSGFVIYYSTFADGKSRSFRSYFHRRFRRIYPIFLVAIGLGYVQYARATGDWSGGGGRDLLGNLLMLQDTAGKPGVWFPAFAGNTPLWSLSYEWWFYMLFWPIAAMTLIPAGNARYFVFCISAAGFFIYQLAPNQICLFLGYFFIWWSGVEVAREYLQTRSITFRRQLPMIVMLGILAVLWLIPVRQAKPMGRALDWHEAPVSQARHMIAAWIFLVGALVWNRARFIGFWPLLGGFRWIAPFSYALYVLHLPILKYGRYFESVPSQWLRLPLYFLLIAAISYLVEQKLQPLLAKIVDRVLARGESCRKQ